MSEEVKRMADLLKSGATMLSDVCPECGTPLFKVKGEVFCAKCNRPVVYARATDQATTKILPEHLLDSVEQTVLAKVRDINDMVRIEQDPVRLRELGDLLYGWLGALERIRNLKSQGH